MSSGRRLPRSTFAVLAALTAACGGAVQLLADGDARTDVADAGEADASNAATSPRETPSADAAPPPDGAPWNAEVWTGECPPQDSPYWDAVFADAGTWGDASVCGVLDAGRIGLDGRLRGAAVCALLAHSGPHAFYSDLVWYCPTAVCETSNFYWGAPCRVPRLVDPDSGACLADLDASYSVFCGASGRRPAEYLAEHGSGRTAAGAYLASQAELEAAAVDAFLDIADELALLGAPEDLIEDARSAARDEVRHVAIATRLARAHGGAVTAHPRREHRPPPRSLARFAEANALEGVVRETFAAAVVVHQATHAADANVRRDFGRIAKDELAHADLSHRLHAWAMSQLDAEGQAAVLAVLRNAATELHDELASTPALDDRGRRDLDALGLPSPDVATRIHAELSARLWS